MLGRRRRRPLCRTRIASVADGGDQRRCAALRSALPRANRPRRCNPPLGRRAGPPELVAITSASALHPRTRVRGCRLAGRHRGPRPMPRRHGPKACHRASPRRADPANGLASRGGRAAGVRASFPPSRLGFCCARPRGRVRCLSLPSRCWSAVWLLGWRFFFARALHSPRVSRFSASPSRLFVAGPSGCWWLAGVAAAPGRRWLSVGCGSLASRRRLGRALRCCSGLRVAWWFAHVRRGWLCRAPCGCPCGSRRSRRRSVGVVGWNALSLSRCTFREGVRGSRRVAWRDGALRAWRCA